MSLCFSSLPNKTATLVTIEFSNLNDLPGLINFCFVQNLVEILLKVCGTSCSLCHLTDGSLFTT